MGEITLVAAPRNYQPIDRDSSESELRRQLQEMLAELPEPYASVLSMVEVEGIGLADAASHLQLREASVRLLYREGRRRLREVVIAHTDAGLL